MASKGMIWRASIMEFIGSFALTFAAVKYIPPSQYSDWKQTGSERRPEPGEAITEIEAAKMTFVLAFFTWAAVAISGAHFNPVVTVAMFMSRKCEPATAIMYLIFQAAGSAAAGFLQFIMTTSLRDNFVKDPNQSKTAWHYYLPFVHNSMNFLNASLCEGIASFLFIIVYLMMMVDKKAPKGVNCFAVGCAYGLAFLSIGQVTGACLNPYIYVLPRIFTFEFLSFPIYIIGPLGGAVGGAVVYRLFLQTPEDSSDSKAPIRSIVV